MEWIVGTVTGADGRSDSTDRGVSWTSEESGSSNALGTVVTGTAWCCQLTAVVDRLLSSFRLLSEFALYRVSTPSGIITIKDVPTKTPIPREDINLS